MEMALWETGFEPRSEQDWMQRGEAALRDGKLVEAEGCFGRALAEDPFDAGAYTRLSGVYWAQGKNEDSLNALLKALELQPGDRNTILECGRVFSALGREEFAKEVFQAYLERNPQDEEVRSRLDALSRPAEQERSPRAAEFFNRHGEIRYGRGNVAHATACFEMAIEEDPLMGDAYNNLGVIKLQGGKTIEALEHFHKALELKPEDGEILINSARGLVLAAQVDTAIDVYREYLRRFPKDSRAWEEFEGLVRQSARPAWKPDGLPGAVADIYRHTAEELRKSGDLTGASEAVEKALRIKPEEPGALYVLASLHQAVGQMAEARRVLDLALAIDPAHAPSLEMLKKLGDGK
ncbi:MAG: tetratricopeptide repeat protein [Syntrophobacteraceae bacterium]|nr:tetratricopeptide repeat protein [Syntrophobacteraceae bacterium]